MDNSRTLEEWEASLPPPPVSEAYRMVAAAGGKAHWMYDRDLGVHIPCCSRRRMVAGEVRMCLNGPLSDDEVVDGTCSEGPHVVGSV